MIDWSGERVARPRGLAVAVAEAGVAAPVLVTPSAQRWSREGVLAWLVAQADEDMLIGLDLSPGLPFVDAGAYFPGWADTPQTAKALWQRVDEACSGSAYLSADGFLAHPAAREHFLQPTYRGEHYAPANGRLRRCEQRQDGLFPSSCMKLIGANQVGKSSLTGMRVLHRLGGRLPVWPFDPLPPAGALIVEVYTTLAARTAGLPRGRSKMRTHDALDAALTHGAIGSEPTGQTGPIDDHAGDAILTAAWLRRRAHDPRLWSPPRLAPAIAATEGWTFGVL